MTKPACGDNRDTVRGVANYRRDGRLRHAIAVVQWKKASPGKERLFVAHSNTSLQRFSLHALMLSVFADLSRSSVVPECHALLSLGRGEFVRVPMLPAALKRRRLRAGGHR